MASPETITRAIILPRIPNVTPDDMLRFLSSQVHDVAEWYTEDEDSPAEAVIMFDTCSADSALRRRTWCLYCADSSGALSHRRTIGQPIPVIGLSEALLQPSQGGAME
jgi:hypothetical protein